MTTTDEGRLVAIRERAAAIIPGPWRWMGNTAVDRVYLATTHSGQQTIIEPATYTTESVYSHEAVEGYTLADARENVVTWCGHEDDPDRTCSCDEIRLFLVGNLDAEEGHRDYTPNWTPYPMLTRSIQVHADLRLPVEGHRMRSYRDFCRYEVLGRKLGNGWGDYRTRGEWEAEEGAVELVDGRTGDRPARTVDDALYREDFCGLAHPEATFIEHAAEDIPFLLAEIDRLREIIQSTAMRAT